MCLGKKSKKNSYVTATFCEYMDWVGPTLKFTALLLQPWMYFGQETEEDNKSSHRSKTVLWKKKLNPAILN